MPNQSKVLAAISMRNDIIAAQAARGASLVGIQEKQMRELITTQIEDTIALLLEFVEPHLGDIRQIAGGAHLWRISPKYHDEDDKFAQVLYLVIHPTHTSIALNPKESERANTLRTTQVDTTDTGWGLKDLWVFLEVLQRRLEKG